MKWSVRGACAALSACLLLGCALGAAAVGLRCFALGAQLRGEPFRLGAAAGAFYSGLLLAAGLALLGGARCCGRGPGGAGARGARGAPGAEEPGARGARGARARARGRGRRAPRAPRAHNLLLLGALVFMLGVLSAFAGAVIDGDTVSLAERKYSHFCRPGVPGPPRPRASAAQCRRLRDYQRGLVLSTVLNALECLLGLLGLLLAKNCRAARRPRVWARAPGPRQPPAFRARRGRRGRRGRGLQPRPSEASILAAEDSDPAPGDCGAACGGAVSFISVGAGPGGAAAGVEVSCAGHPSVELPGYAPSDPELDASYPYCCRARGR
ncbi:transmembrane protein 271 [Erinaceus europaeus]|uniref:Transmembrane protein 271 n=1 Tax=Erinaceus europaeus TaxID=9365 RepID=A0ABM3X6G2_ERIEU|nr:transmembrane protein 271 [Erinaceus europaeus]